MADKVEVDPPGFRYTASKNPFNTGVVWRFVLLSSEIMDVADTVECIKTDAGGVSDLEDELSMLHPMLVI